jgi:hypothetical protein
MKRYRILVHPDVRQYLHHLEHAARTQPTGLRARELRALRAGLRGLTAGDEDQFEGKRLGFTTHDLSDCAEIKLPVIPQSRGDRELGSSHRLIYREFQPEDGGLPYREVICFEPRRDDRPFHVAAERLNRAPGIRRDPTRTFGASSPIAPIRQPLIPDLRIALAAAADVAPASGAAHTQALRLHSRTVSGPPTREL